MPKIAIYAAGSNSHGQLAIGSKVDAHEFTRCLFEYPLNAGRDFTAKITAGANHALLLLDTGDRQDLFVTGSSRRCQLGLQSEVLHLTFTPLHIKDLLPCLSSEDWSRLPTSARNLQIKDVAAGWETSFLLLENKRDPAVTRIVAMGTNDHGQLGRISTADQICVIPVSSPSGIAKILAGPRHTVAIDKMGRASGWGPARHGQLDHLNILSNHIPKQAMLIGFTSTQSYSSVALGHQHSVLISSDQRIVRSIGSNKKGQLGSGGSKDVCATFTLSDRSQMTAYTTWSSSFLLNQVEDSSTLMSFGNNAHGQLGREETILGRRGDVVFPLAEYQIVQLAAGSEHVLALLAFNQQREVWGWGWNEHGNLGLKENLEDIKIPVRVWTSEGRNEKVHSIHAGYGTSWIVVVEET